MLQYVRMGGCKKCYYVIHVVLCDVLPRLQGVESPDHGQL